MIRKRGIIVISILVTVLIIASAAVYAADTSWYQNNAYILATNTVVKSALRYIGWIITLGLCYVSDAVGMLYDYTFALIDITKYGEINEIITRLQPVLAALIIASVAFLGLSMIVERQKKPQLVRNILLSALVVSMSLSAFTMLNNMAEGFKDGILGDAKKTNQSYEIVNANIIDLVALDKAGNINSVDYSAGTGIKVGAGIKSAETMGLVDINETLNYSDSSEGMDLYGWSAAFNEKIGKKLTVIKDGGYELKPIYDGVLLTTIGNEFYYRYTVSYLSCWLQILAYLIMIVALSYKNVRIMYELVVARILSYLHAADITSGERLKQILLFIRDTYIVLGISILSVKLFTVLNARISSMGISAVGAGIGGAILKGIICLFIAFCVIDGPNIAERLLGMDAGLSRSLARTWGIIEMGRSLSHGARNISGKISDNVSSRTNSKSTSAVNSVSAGDNRNSSRGDQAIDKMDHARSDGAGNAAETPSSEAARTQEASAVPPLEVSGAPPQDSTPAPDNNISSVGADSLSSNYSEPPSQNQDNSKMHVDFMETGSQNNAIKTVAEGIIPERKTQINSGSNIKIPEKKISSGSVASVIKPEPAKPAASSSVKIPTDNKPINGSNKTINLNNSHTSERSEKDGKDK